MCSHPGCPRVVPGGVSRCERHAAKREAEIQARRAAADARRPSAAERGYGDPAWRRTRRLFIEAHPTCSEPGCGRPTVDVHHVRSVREAPELRLSWSNLRGYCHSHHSAVTGRTQGGWAQGGNG